ncbi:N-acetyltransferase [bacterium]|nr:N-acetyltransferase [bacterium]
MKIRHTEIEDLPRIEEIYAYARRFMRESGNSEQWKDSRPSAEAMRRDIDRGNSYVVEDDSGRICGVFAFVIGEDPTYAHIEGGRWLNDRPYGTLHRIAGDGTFKGLFKLILDFCEAQTSDIRIDTHRDNAIMRRLTEKNGFRYCGVIYVDDGTPRLAYHKICR